MKKAISLIGWCFVLFTTVSLVFTILTTYQFVYIKYFNSYYTLQWCIFFTMSIWAIKLVSCNKNKTPNKIYPILCMIFAVGTIFFIFMRVY